MHQEWADKWVEALRSGKYNQTRGKLKEITLTCEAFCCLGVLCDIVGVKWADNVGTISVTSVRGVPLPYPHAHTLPKEVMAICGMRSDSGYMSDNHTTTLSLGNRNDGCNGTGPFPSCKPHTFNEISDIIAANVGAL